jgi:hypothetical protein
MHKVDPSWMGKKATRKRRVKDSQGQERRVGEAGGGRRVRGSGSKPHARGDAVWEQHGILLEAKRTEKKSISVKGEVLDRITREAMATGKVPALAIEVKTEFAVRDWVALPLPVLLKILEDAGGEEEG